MRQDVVIQDGDPARACFGGSYRYVALDNLKEGVAKRDLYAPELNPLYAATLAQSGVVADPARVGDANRKGTVENAIGHNQATALKGRRFDSIEEEPAAGDHERLHLRSRRY